MSTRRPRRLPKSSAINMLPSDFQVEARGFGANRMEFDPITWSIKSSHLCVQSEIRSGEFVSAIDISDATRVVFQPIKSLA